MKQKRDSDDSDDDEESTLHRLLFNFLDKSISQEDQTHQLKRQLAGQHQESKKQRRAAEAKVVQHQQEAIDAADAAGSAEAELRSRLEAAERARDEATSAREAADARASEAEKLAWKQAWEQAWEPACQQAWKRVQQQQALWHTQVKAAEQLQQQAMAALSKVVWQPGMVPQPGGE